jgi:hypothetical protein
MEIENVVRFFQAQGADPMTNQKLRELLEQLHTELARTDSVDDQGREMLRDLSGDIQKLLDEPGSNMNADESTLQKMKQTIDRLEVTHPTLTMALSEIMTILSNAGI